MNSTIANADPVGGICDVLSNRQMRILQCEWQMIHENPFKQTQLLYLSGSN
jgi:hypothetical protein